MPINYYCAIAMNGSDIEMNKNQLQLPVIDNESSAPTSPVEGQCILTRVLVIKQCTSTMEPRG